MTSFPSCCYHFLYVAQDLSWILSQSDAENRLMTLGLGMGHRARLLSNASCLTGTKRIELGIMPVLPEIDAMSAPRGRQGDDVDRRLAGEVHTEQLNLADLAVGIHGSVSSRSGSVTGSGLLMAHKPSRDELKKHVFAYLGSKTHDLTNTTVRTVRREVENRLKRSAGELDGEEEKAIVNAIIKEFMRSLYCLMPWPDARHHQASKAALEVVEVEARRLREWEETSTLVSSAECPKVVPDSVGGLCLLCRLRMPPDE
jgi:hypothetical protein